MKNKLRLFGAFLVFGLTLQAAAQPVGTIRGVVIDAASLVAKEPIEDMSRMMEGQHPTSIVVHATINYRIHSPRVTHEFGFKMLNITGNKEYYGFDYNRATGRFDDMTATVGIPNIYYKISF